MDEQPKKRKGFAGMSPEKQRQIAAKGGRSVPRENRSFSRSPELAKAAGQLGGRSVPSAKRTFSQDRTLAQWAGRRGGANSAAKRPGAQPDPETSS